MGLISVEKSAGKGRAVVLMYDSTEHQPLSPQQLADDLSNSGTVHLLQVKQLRHSQVEQCAHDLNDALTELSVRQASFVTFGGCATVLWKLAVDEQRKIRNALVINGETRPRTNWFERLLQRIEEFLPLGLPFRVNEGKFYALPFLERFRFPVIVVALPSASERIRSESSLLAQALPVAWSMEIEGKDLVQELTDAHGTLQGVPPKRPQKRRKQAAA